ncbi:MAG: L,D-transpeptidase family protein [Chthoniobacterales bacterium]
MFRFAQSFLALLSVVAAISAGAAEENETKAALAHSQQLLLVTAGGWDNDHGTLTLWERAPGGRWRRVAEEMPVMLGRNGLAWGIGLHAQRPTKREGDGRAPAGLFELDRIYGRDAAAPSAHFPYTQMSELMLGIDDSQSRSYNRLLDGAQVPAAARDWKRAEKLRAANPMFRWCVTVKHNWEQRPAMGSCIYLHIWKAPGVATAGCTAMATESLARVVHWLDARKRPLLLQGPRDVPGLRGFIAEIEGR